MHLRLQGKGRVLGTTEEIHGITTLRRNGYDLEVGRKEDRGIYVKTHAVGKDNRKHLPFSHQHSQLGLFPPTSRNRSFQFYDRTHRIHFAKICFPSNFSKYSALQRLSELNLK